MSGCVALRPRVPGGVVTWFVTGWKLFRSRYKIVGSAEPRRGRAMAANWQAVQAARLPGPFHVRPHAPRPDSVQALRPATG